MTIVNIRGTHGAGKSTAVTRILQKYPHLTVRDDKGKIIGYRVTLPNKKSLGIVGKYETACGGADGIQPYSDIWPRVEMFAKLHDHVLFEGALISVSYGSIGKASEAYGDDFVFAFMNTPMAQCVAQVNQRRAAAGKEPLENTVNIESKHKSCERLAMKLTNGDTEGVPKRNIVWISSGYPATDVLKLFGVKLTKEPA